MRYTPGCDARLARDGLILVRLDVLTNKPLIIIPAYNEAGSIARVVADLRRHLPEADLLVVDDGSTDATAAAVPSEAHVLSLPFNQGIGGAMQTGYRYAAQHGYAIAVQVDGDGQHPADQVPRLLDRLRQGDVNLVIGSRFLHEADDNYRPPPARMAAIGLLRSLISVLTRRRITDCTSGFRAVDRHLIEAFTHWYPDDYPEPEVLVLLHRAGFRFAEVPIRMQPRTAGETSIPFRRGVFYVVKVAAALVLDLVRHPWPDSLRRK